MRDTATPGNRLNVWVGERGICTVLHTIRYVKQWEGGLMFLRLLGCCWGPKDTFSPVSHVWQPGREPNERSIPRHAPKKSIIVDAAQTSVKCTVEHRKNGWYFCAPNMADGSGWFRGEVFDPSPSPLHVMLDFPAVRVCCLGVLPPYGSPPVMRISATWLGRWKWSLMRKMIEHPPVFLVGNG